jgi:phosphoribosyl 1,2-cyclic phosphate phosphodiesterase
MSEAAAMLRLRILGTSAAWPIPRWGCDCAMCERAREFPAEHRSRSALLVDERVLVDAGPDIYAQLAELPPAVLRGIEAIVITHAHADHYLGLDDLSQLRRVSGRRGYPLYALPDNWPILQRTFGFLIGGDSPEHAFRRRDLALGHPLAFGRLRITAFDTQHSRGFTTGGLWLEKGGKGVVYAPDFNWTDFVPPAPPDLVIMGGSSLERKFAGHASIPEVVEVSQGWGARRLIITHIGHLGLPLAALRERLATYGPHIEPAVDEMVVEV